MSLINDVLRDLERRGARAGSTEAPCASVRWRTPPELRGASALALLLACTLALWLAMRGPSSTLDVAAAPPAALPPSASAPLPEAPRIPVVELRPRSDVPEPPPATLPRPAVESLEVGERTIPLGAEELDLAPPSGEDARPSIVIAPTSEDLAERALAVARRDETAAIPLLERALGRDPLDASLRVALAGALIRLGRASEARACVHDGLELTPENPALVEIEARFLVDEGRLEEARVRLQAVLDEPEWHPDVAAFLAALELRLGSATRASELYRAALRGAPDNESWWMGLGLAFEQAARPDDARTAFESALASGRLAERPARFVRARILALAKSKAR